MNSHFRSDSAPASRVTRLMEGARRHESNDVGELLELYRNYLTILAATQLDRRLRRRLNPSDLVQETMLAAHRDFEQFRGSNERQLLAWLRQILIHCLHRAVQTHIKSKRRDVRCELPIEPLSASLDGSLARLARSFSAPGDSPSASLRQQERAVALANQLAKLRPDYRNVIVLRNLQGLCFEEVAERMDRNPGAVRMLWLRAIEKFKLVYDPYE